MSGQCPVCSQPIESQFGMVQCVQCHAVLFIDFSGNIVVGDSDQHNQIATPEESPHYELVNNEPIQEQGVIEDTNGFNDIELTSNEYSQINSEDESVNWDTPSSQVDSDVTSDDFSSQKIETSNSNTIEPFSSSNTNESMNYKIQIKGIDSSGLRQSVIQSLKDKRLGLVGSEISERIDKGQLNITGLNPVKASVIMNALKEFPLEIEWELYGKNDTES